MERNIERRISHGEMNFGYLFFLQLFVPTNNMILELHHVRGAFVPVRWYLTCLEMR